MLLLIGLWIGVALGQAPFGVEETTITEVHMAMRAGRLSCRALVDSYLRRIAAFDKNGPALNALVIVNPSAPQEADALDRDFAVPG